MSSEKWTCNDKAEDLEKGYGAKERNVKEKNRRLSWHSIPKAFVLDRTVSLDMTSKDELRLEKEKGGDLLCNSISDGELDQSTPEHKTKDRKRKSMLKNGHRRVKSLGRFELNEYTVRDIRKLQEKLATRQPKFKAKNYFFKNFSGKQKLIFMCLCLIDFTGYCSISIMAPFFPREAKEKGMSESTSGFVFSFYALIIFLSSPFLGKLLPEVGAKFLFLAGLFISSSCNLLFGLLVYIKQEWVFVVYCFLVEGLKALGASAYSTASYVIIAEVFPSNLGAVLGLMETFVGLGMSLGPVIGGFFYHIGGFALPFYVLGGSLILMLPLAFWVLPCIQGSNVKKKSGFFFETVTEPCVIIIGLVIIATSNIWAFLDPTLEPHLRQFDLTPEKIGLIFLLFSALYGLSSPLWGVVSDKTNNHWFMMTSGLMFSTVGLLLLGPAPFIPFLKSEIWLNIVALAILGVSVALSLLPTFQGLLNSISLARGCQNDISTYSIVAGAWSSLYALGEVIGPLLGGLITEHYGFPMCCTIMAAATFTLAIGSFIYFVVRDCLTERGRNYRYKFDDSSDGYESDYVNSSDDLENQPMLQSDYHTRLYVEEKCF